MAEPIRKRLDRVLDHIDEVGASATQIVLSRDDLQELEGDHAPDAQASYRRVVVRQGQIGRSSYVEARGAPSGDANFGV